MDLNLLYTQHQGSLMSAAAATSQLARARHLAAAEAFADRIRKYQLSRGASAAAGWLRAVQNSEQANSR